MAKEGTTSFDVQAEMRAFAEKGVEQARAASTVLLPRPVGGQYRRKPGHECETGVKEVGELAKQLCRAQYVLANSLSG